MEPKNMKTFGGNNSSRLESNRDADNLPKSSTVF